MVAVSMVVMFVLFVFIFILITVAFLLEPLIQFIQTLFLFAETPFSVLLNPFDRFFQLPRMLFDEMFDVANVVLHGLFDFSHAKFKFTLHVVHIAMGLFNRPLNLIGVSCIPFDVLDGLAQLPNHTPKLPVRTLAGPVVLPLVIASVQAGPIFMLPVLVSMPDFSANPVRKSMQARGM